MNDKQTHELLIEINKTMIQTNALLASMAKSLHTIAEAAELSRPAPGKDR